MRTARRFASESGLAPSEKFFLSRGEERSEEATVSEKAIDEILGVSIMAANDYHLISRWEVEATPEEVYRILIRPEEYPQWWPEGFLSVSAHTQGHERVGTFHTRGYLPYTLRFQAKIVEERYPRQFTAEVRGDFNGRAICSLSSQSERVVISFDWKVCVTKPLIRYASRLLKPLFASNHRWVMRRGQVSLRRELQRLAGVSSLRRV